MIRHPVDVPVTALDDSDDDVVFHERAESLDDLDYEYRPPTYAQRLASWFKRTPPSAPAYEMMDMSEGAPPARHPLQGKVKATFKGTIAIFGTVLVAVVVAFFFLAPSITNQPQFTSGYVAQSNGSHTFQATTILISLDGFHPHYISRDVTPVLHDVYTNGYSSPYLTPSFPSSTFPNHWTLVTGLYPGDHGIVGNTFWDPKEGQFVNVDPKRGALDPKFWKGGEPIWTTAKRQGLKTAVHMWPGSEVPEVGAEWHDKYNASETLSAKVDQIMAWLDADDDTRPQLVLAYVPTVDTYGHRYGISGPDLEQALREVDSFVGTLHFELDRRHLRGLVNVVITSDHGMAPTSKDRLLMLEDLVNMTSVDHVDGWPLYGLRPKEGVDVKEMADSIRAKIADKGQQDHYDVFLKEDIPEQYNYGAKSAFADRIAPLWIFPHVGYSVSTHERMAKNGGELKPVGVHGYNNTELLMRAIFMAEGPYFSSNRYPLKMEPFENTNVYAVVCDSLGLNPAPNNGTRVLTRLPSGWHDESVYPGLDFEVEHLVHTNNTYDYLYRNPPAKTVGETVGGVTDGVIDGVKGFYGHINNWWSGNGWMG
ncbi:ectonucleotide pyrophosphatase/phosphodiesterase 1 [Diutina catenulata]